MLSQEPAFVFFDPATLLANPWNASSEWSMFLLEAICLITLGVAVMSSGTASSLSLMVLSCIPAIASSSTETMPSPKGGTRSLFLLPATVAPIFLLARQLLIFSCCEEFSSFISIAVGVSAIRTAPITDGFVCSNSRAATSPPTASIILVPCSAASCFNSTSGNVLIKDSFAAYAVSSFSITGVIGVPAAFSTRHPVKSSPWDVLPLKGTTS